MWNFGIFLPDLLRIPQFVPKRELSTFGEMAMTEYLGKFEKTFLPQDRSNYPIKVRQKTFKREMFAKRKKNFFIKNWNFWQKLKNKLKLLNRNNFKLFYPKIKLSAKNRPIKYFSAVDTVNGGLHWRRFFRWTYFLYMIAARG